MTTTTSTEKAAEKAAAPKAEAPTLGPDDRILPDGRMVRLMLGRVYAVELQAEDDARSRRGGNLFGGPGQALPELDAKGEPTGRDLRVAAVYEAEDAKARHRALTFDSGRRFQPLAVHPHDPARDEVARLEALGLHASAEIVRKANPPAERDPALEALGDVTWAFAQCQAQGIGADVAVERVRAFAAGDWGANGKAEDVELDDLHRLAAPAFGPDVRNAVALESGRGFVAGVYPFVRERVNGQLQAPRFVDADDRTPGERGELRVEFHSALRSTIVYTA